MVQTGGRRRSPVIYLALNIFFAISFNQWLRYGQRRGANVHAVGSVNYVIATVACWTWLALSDLPEDGGILAALGFGGLAGGVFFLAFITLMTAYRAAGVGIAVAFMGSSVIVPSVASWLIWGEEMTAMRWVAVALLPAAVVLMRPPATEDRAATWKGNAALLAIFCLSGLAQTMHKAASEEFPELKPAYLTGIFAVAAVCTTIHALKLGRPWARRDAGIGVVVGLSNSAAMGCQMLALAALPAVVYFPTAGPALICLNLIMARLLWDERIVRRQAVGVAVAVAVVLLTNLGVGGAGAERALRLRHSPGSLFSRGEFSPRRQLARPRCHP